MDSVDEVSFRDADDRLDYAQEKATAAGLSGDEVAKMMAYLLGATLTHFDETPVIPMTDSRWRRIVHSAIREAAPK